MIKDACLKLDIFFYAFVSMIKMLSKFRMAFKAALITYKNGGYKMSKIAYVDYDSVLEGKTVLITGGSTGIGLAIAEKSVKSGANVVITGRNESQLEEVSRKLGCKCSYVVWDISDISILSNKIREVKLKFGGKIDVLINNAGIAPSKFWGNVDEDEWDKIYSINLKGMYFLTQEICKDWLHLSDNNVRKIVNISSQGAFVGATYPYRLTKWDIRGLTQGLGKELVRNNIIVNGIAPGIVKTKMQQFSLQQENNIYCNQNPSERFCYPEEIAELALFLIGDASNFIVGQTIVCDGGFSLI